MKLRILFLNGPPGCGKDTAAEFLVANGWHHMKFADPLKDATCHLLGISRKELELKKNERLEDTALTLREFLITLSEDTMKPLFGKDHFGKLAGQRVAAWHARTRTLGRVVFSDSGFEHEVMGCLTHLNDLEYEFEYGIIKIVRPGCDFFTDSRSFLSGGVTIDNDGSLEQFRSRLLKEIEEW